MMDYTGYLKHKKWMTRVLELAKMAGDAGEVPVATVIVNPGGDLIAEAQNRRERDFDPTAHAEILALRKAGLILRNWNLNQCTLYVNLEPCPMCAGAILQARIGLLVYGVDDPKTGSIRTVANFSDSAFSNHRLSVLGGIMETACRQQLQSWFVELRYKD
jgi:tRNA(adenine34) deaminase